MKCPYCGYEPTNKQKDFYQLTGAEMRCFTANREYWITLLLACPECKKTFITE